MARVSFPAPFKMVQTICRVSFAFWRGGVSFLGFCAPDAFFFFFFFLFLRLFRRGIPEHREGDAQCTGFYLKDALRPLHIGAKGAEHEQQTQHQHHQQQNAHPF